METLQFTIQINAHPEVVFNTIIDPVHFQQWTSAFSPTSHFKGTWEKGTIIHFLAEDDNGDTSGMISRIKEIKPNEFISIEHIGLIQNGKEITEGEEVESIKGALENYTIIQKDNKTELKVDSDTFPEMKAFFLETWPKALEDLKRISEEQSNTNK
jgi:uncharacterized protein YndB with AHSA1/START domain